MTGSGRKEGNNACSCTSANGDSFRWSLFNIFPYSNCINTSINTSTCYWDNPDSPRWLAFAIHLTLTDFINPFNESYSPYHTCIRLIIILSYCYPWGQHIFYTALPNSRSFQLISKFPAKGSIWWYDISSPGLLFFSPPLHSWLAHPSVFPPICRLCLVFHH